MCTLQNVSGRLLHQSILAALLLSVAGVMAETIEDDFQADTLHSRYVVEMGEWAVSNGVLSAHGVKGKSLLLSSPEAGTTPLHFSVDWVVENPQAENCSLGITVFKNSEQSILIAYRGGAGNVMRLLRFIGPKSNMQTLPLNGSVTPGTWYRLTVSTPGDGSYEVSLVERDKPENALGSGTLKTSTPVGAGKVGLFITGPTDAQFDNFSLKTE